LFPDVPFPRRIWCLRGLSRSPCSPVSPDIPTLYEGKDEGTEWRAAYIASQLQE
jgi:hypothetical protein